jgi:hypothetical protein
LGKDKLSTEELLTILKNSDTLEVFFESVENNLPNLTTSEYLAQLLDEHRLIKQEVIRHANLERAFGYQIFNGTRNPRRNPLLRVALTMKLSVAETQRLLKIAQRGELYVKNRRDAAIIYCIRHKLSLVDTEILLDNIGEALLK